MARQGNNKNKPAHARYNSANRRHKNKLKKARKRFTEFEKRYPGKYQLIGYQIALKENKFVTEDVRDTAGNITKRVVVTKGNEEKMKQRLIDFKKKKIDNERIRREQKRKLLGVLGGRGRRRK